MSGAPPGFGAGAALAPPRGRYRATGERGSSSAAGGIRPAAVLVWTGHCGCPADRWFGLPCVCYDVVADPPNIVPVPAWEYGPGGG